MRICRKISYVAGVALAIAMLHDQTHAQASGCVVMEVVMEDQQAFTSELPPAVEKQYKAKNPKHPAQQATIDQLIGSRSAPRFGSSQHGSTEKEDGGTTSSTRERAFASAQDLTDYCMSNVETRK